MNTNFQLSTKDGCWWYTARDKSRRHVAYTGDHWITVSRLMPNQNEELLVSDGASDVFIARWTGNSWLNEFEMDVDVAAWQPMPEPFVKPFLQEVA